MPLTLRLATNKPTYLAGTFHKLTVAVENTGPAAVVDAFVVAKLPDGSRFSLKPGGTFVAGVSPYLSGLALPEGYTLTDSPLYEGPLPPLPFGAYIWEAGLTAPGTGTSLVRDERPWTLAEGGTPMIPGPHPTFRAARYMGADPVNRWPWIDAEACCSSLYRAGCTFLLLEAVPWCDMDDDINMGNYAQFGRTDTVYPDELKAWAAAAKKYHLTLATTLVNWNSQAMKVKGNDWYRMAVQWLKDNVAGPKDVLPSGAPVLLIEPVSEPDNSAEARERMQTVADAWGGPLLMNGAGGRGGPAVPGDMVDWHWCRQADFFNDIKPKGFLNSTDCGSFPCNPGPEVVGQMARHALAHDTTTFIYGFIDKSPMRDEIAAMGGSIQQGGVGTRPYVVPHSG